jgi:hypothetical protein
MSEYNVNITLTEPMLATSPANPSVYTEFIASKKQGESPSDELSTLPADKRELTGWSVFHKDDKGLFIFDYHLRGFLKEAAAAVVDKDKDKGVPAVRSKIDKWLFVFPRRLYLYNASDQYIVKPDDINERSIRAMTMQGPRTSLKRSDIVNAGSWFQATIKVLPLGERELNANLLRSCLNYGEFTGLGEWRTGSYGRFKYELVSSNGTA